MTLFRHASELQTLTGEICLLHCRNLQRTSCVLPTATLPSCSWNCALYMTSQALARPLILEVEMWREHGAPHSMLLMLRRRRSD